MGRDSLDGDLKIAHSIGKDFFQEDSLTVDTYRNIQHVSTVVTMKWMPFKGSDLYFINAIEYDRDRVSMVNMAQELCAGFPAMLKKWERQSILWDEYQARIYNRVWRRAWRNITARWRKFTTRTSTTS